MRDSKRGTQEHDLLFVLELESYLPNRVGVSNFCLALSVSRVPLSMDHAKAPLGAFCGPWSRCTDNSAWHGGSTHAHPHPLDPQHHANTLSIPECHLKLIHSGKRHVNTWRSIEGVLQALMMDGGASEV